MSIISILLAVIIAATLVILLMAITSRKNKAVKTNNGSIPKNKNVIVKECTKKLTQDPHNVSALTALSEVYFSEQEYEKAYPLYNTLFNLARVHPNLDKAKIVLRFGICAYRTAHYDESGRAFVEILRDNPKSFEGNLYLGKIFLEKKEFDKAIMCLKRAMSMNPDSMEVYEPLAYSLFQAKKYRESLTYLKKVLDVSPENKEAMFFMASALEETGLNDKAIKIFMHLRPDPIFGAQSCLEAGSIHEKQGLYDKAIQDYEIAIKLENVQKDLKINVCYRLANAYIAKHDISKALTYLRQIQATTPNYKDVNSLINRYQELNQNANLQAYIMSGTSDFVALCRKFVTGYYSDAFVKIEDISVAAESIEVLCTVDSAKWEDTELFRFFRSTGSVGELYIRDFHSKMRDIKCERGFCVTAGSFTDEAHKYVEGRPIDLIEKNKLVAVLKRIDVGN